MASLGLALAGCGGGGSSGDSSTSSGPPPLTEVQQAVQDAYLSSAGGVHSPTVSLPYAGLPSPSAGFYAFDLAFTLPSPLTSTSQRVTVTLNNYTSTLGLPDPATGVPGRPLINGKIYIAASLPTTWDERLRLSGDHVVSENMATDGVTVASAVRIVGHAPVPLSGLLADAPPELKSWPILSLLWVNPALANPGAAFQPGATYYRRQSVREGDVVFINDCGATTTGAAPSPCGTASTLEAAFPQAYLQHTYNLSDGTVQTLQGLRAWVSNQPLPGIPTTQQLVMVEMGGQVLRGNLQRDGTPIRYNLTNGTVVDYWPRFNKQANDSLKAALLF